MKFYESKDVKPRELEEKLPDVFLVRSAVRRWSRGLCRTLPLDVGQREIIQQK